MMQEPNKAEIEAAIEQIRNTVAKLKDRIGFVTDEQDERIRYEITAMFLTLAHTDVNSGDSVAFMQRELLGKVYEEFTSQLRDLQKTAIKAELDRDTVLLMAGSLVGIATKRAMTVFSIGTNDPLVAASKSSAVARTCIQLARGFVRMHDLCEKEGPEAKN